MFVSALSDFLKLNTNLRKTLGGTTVWIELFVAKSAATVKPNLRISAAKRALFSHRQLSGAPDTLPFLLFFALFPDLNPNFLRPHRKAGKAGKRRTKPLFWSALLRVLS